MKKKILAWYFSDGSRRLRYGDGREISLGVEHTVKRYPEPCQHELHGCERLIDALDYAPGTIVWRVELSGRIKKDGDKIAATRRKYVAGGIDISDLLRFFARKQALSVAHLWDMPAIVREYLETGDETKRSAAESAAYSAARSASGSAAWSAARSAAESAAWSASGSAARSASYSAAYSAARSVSGSAAWSAARSAANEMLTEMVELAIDGDEVEA